MTALRTSPVQIREPGLPPDIPSSPAIGLHDLTRQFGRGKRLFTAVSQLNLEVARGQVFGLLGPNGSGKTTTINMISGLIPPTSGSISILGKDIRRHRQQILRRL